MGIKKLILNIMLSICNVFVRLRKIDQKDQIAFVSLESRQLESDLKLIHDALQGKGYHLCERAYQHFEKNSLWMNFLYFLNTIKQIFVINTSALVIINDNNYVISNFKRKGVTVLQVWHAAGAIKKFGNVIKREYPIANYDYVICNGDYWKQPYSEAFGVDPSACDRDRHAAAGPSAVIRPLSRRPGQKLFQEYPELKGKKIILYAPTFRGNIYEGMQKVDLDVNRMMHLLKAVTMRCLYKLHPLLRHEKLSEDRRVYNMNDRDLHELFCIADVLVSDFSSIIFDFSLLHKPVYYYVPDLEQYLDERGCFVDFKEMSKGCLAVDEEELADLINSGKNGNEKQLRRYIDVADGRNCERTVALISDLMRQK